ncbi:Type II secretion system protein F [Polystyrenella longa]|uniref:Type II secretion system protein F n=1 Tax=Polystyrenella longa TaxID=2528007 RepID=A0A518CRQ2_9PLAN|nr:type II secretion system F family protein [Polystyrenella longa]QDU81890.1 Type II secretion system protein F [Polystyrenella longa]
MPYAYKAKSKSGEISTGVLDGHTEQEARESLRRQQLFPLSVTETKSNQTSSKKSKKSGRLTLNKRSKPSRRRKIPRTEILFFTTQLAIMCRSGIDLAASIHNIAQQTTHEAFRETLLEIHSEVSDGKSVSAALENQPHAFDATYIASVAAGEAAGRVPHVLNRMAELIRNEVRLISTLKQVMAYPLVLVGVCGLVLLALIFFVLPQFAQVFQDLGTVAPPFTQLLLDISSLIRENLLILSLGTIACSASLFCWSRTESAHRRRDSFLLYFPLIRAASQAVMIGRVFQLLGTLLQSGIPLLESLQLCQRSLKNMHYQSLFQRLEDEVISGRSIGSIFMKADFIPRGAAQMVLTAEQTGNLGTVLTEVGSFFEDEGERQVKGLTKVLEPAIIVVTGAVVAGIVLAIMLPLLDVSTQSH